MDYLRAEELLAGSSLVHDIEIPLTVLVPARGPSAAVGPRKVRMRPLTVHDIQRVTKAARDDDTLLSIVMLREAMVEPALTFEEVNGLHAGVARFLLEELNRISGLAVDQDTLTEAVQAPLARACFILAREFGWSPQEVGDLTMGQVLLYIEMLGHDPAQAQTP
jgi:hypothetical protein